MSRLLCLAFLLISSLGLASCDPVRHERTVAYGIGTDLYTPEMARATVNLGNYLGYLCQQASLTGVNSAEGPRCFEQAMGPREWTLLVSTGWNDIDSRCDAYLAWLDNQRRSRLFVNAQVAHVRTLASGIFGVIDISREAIAIVGVALGFVQDTYNSYNDRILMDIEGSTVETIVITRRLEYRTQFAHVLITTKPDAVRVLRDYMRICTPYAIKMDVNTYSRAAAMGDLPPEMNDPRLLRESLIGSVLHSAVAPIPRPVIRRTEGPHRLSPFEESLSPNDIDLIQTAVCVAPSGDLGASGSPTRLAAKRILNTDHEALTDRDGVLLLRRVDRHTGNLRAGVTC